MKTQNTVLSDLNELLCGAFLSGSNWHLMGNDAFEQYNLRTTQATEDENYDVMVKSAAMSIEFKNWAYENGYSGNIIDVWWTARPNSMSYAVGFKVDQKKNPTDILVQFEDGPFKGFLGLSAKSTHGKTDIGFKNPGIGTIDRKLNLNLSQEYKQKVAAIIAEYSLPKSAKLRKAYIRENEGVKIVTERIGSEVLSELADKLYHRMMNMSQDELRNYIINDWMDANELSVPYVKVTGFGDGTAKVCNPLENDKLELLKSGIITLHRVGNESIGVATNNVKVMKIRFKFESEKMASSVKLSGESW